MKNERCSNCKGAIRKGPTVKTADGKPFTMKYCPCTDELNAFWNGKMKDKLTTPPTEKRRNATMRIWTITFYGSSIKILIKAASRKEAINFYCRQNYIKPSSYIKCRRATKGETYDESI